MLLPTGAELFAKRRKKSEKWVVDETTVRSSSSTSSTMESTSPAPKLPVPAASYLTNGTAKVHNVQRMNEIQVSAARQSRPVTHRHAQSRTATPIYPKIFPTYSHLPPLTPNDPPS